VKPFLMWKGDAVVNRMVQRYPEEYHVVGEGLHLEAHAGLVGAGFKIYHVGQFTALRTFGRFRLPAAYSSDDSLSQAILLKGPGPEAAHMFRYADNLRRSDRITASLDKSGQNADNPVIRLCLRTEKSLILLVELTRIERTTS
jgi:hypothetical protein